MTWLHALNVFVVQWFGVRLVRVSAGNRHVRYGLIGPVLPMTGWWSDYIGWTKLYGPF